MAEPAGWDETDSRDMKRARVAWIELSMFPKAVLRVEQRGIRPAQAYARAKNRLERWIAGDRGGLWREVMEGDTRRRGKATRGGGMKWEDREQRVNKMAGLGRVSMAVQAIISPGLAADTPAVQRKVAAKFPRRNLLVEEGRVLPEAMAALWRLRLRISSNS